MELSEHLFRRESGRLVAALTRIFGVHNLALAEDVVQDAFCRALEVWKVRGVPENPAAWLMAVAKHRALDIVRRERTARTFAPESAARSNRSGRSSPRVDEAFALSTIRDEQLRMMFSCCHPRLPGGRPGRARAEHPLRLRRGGDRGRVSRRPRGGREADLARKEGPRRLEAAVRSRRRRVRRAAVGSAARALSALQRGISRRVRGRSRARRALREAIRLTSCSSRLREAASPETYALAALMCLQAARLPTRLDAAGDLSPLLEQDRSRWDAQLVEQGLAWLDRSATGAVLSRLSRRGGDRRGARDGAQRRRDRLGRDRRAVRSADGDRARRLSSRSTARSRSGSATDPTAGSRRFAPSRDSDRLRRYPFYPAAMGEMELRRGNLDAARDHFSAAAALARNRVERRFLERRARECVMD